MSERLCCGCGTPLQIGPRERNPKKWCSQKCRTWKQAHPDQLRPTVKECEACGADISDTQRTKFCSRRCQEVASGRRLAEPLPESTCALPECDTVFVPQREAQRCCSEWHGKVLWNRESRADGRQPVEPWNEQRRQRWRERAATKRAASTGVPVVRDEIGERDGWVCHICDRLIDPAVSWPDPLSASLDHEIPISKGGAHDPANARIAHLRCNVAKGNRDAPPIPIR